MAAALLATPVLAAGPSVPAAAEVARLEAECARLRTELERANGDVAALKRSDRGVRHDYRLRQRMADAEALARRLTDAEASLRARKGPAPAPRAPTVAPPSAEPGDGPVELQAKADLLADQARRLASEADGLARVAGQLRGRQALRRRAHQLDRDPFAGLDATKRTMIFGSARQADDQEAGGPGFGGSQPGNKSGGGGAGGGSMDSATPNRGSGPAMGAAPPSNTTAPPATPPTTPQPTAEGALTAPPAGPAPQPTNALSTQLRTLLDPLTLSEVQRLERTGRPITDPASLEKLATALRQRAQTLDAQAKTLRARAAKP